MGQQQRDQLTAWIHLSIIMVVAAGVVLATSQSGFAAGNVTVNVQSDNKKNIRITGDDADNNIEIVSDRRANKITVTGLNGTKVNGQREDTISTLGKAAVVVAMRRGDDLLSFEADDHLFWNIFMQNGNDKFETVGTACKVKKLRLQMENGNDTTRIHDCHADTLLRLDGGSGNDSLYASLLDGTPISIRRYESKEVSTVSLKSTFDKGTDGWTMVGDALGAYEGTDGDLNLQPFFASNEGNPGGAISAIDGGRQISFYFQAPPRFLGNQVRHYGDYLEYDVKFSGPGTVGGTPDVVLAGGGLTLVIDLSPNPTTEWMSYRVRLHKSAGWRISNARTGEKATRTDIQNVLKNLSVLRIRGEYTNQIDVGFLDNVRIRRD